MGEAVACRCSQGAGKSVGKTTLGRAVGEATASSVTCPGEPGTT